MMGCETLLVAVLLLFNVATSWGSITDKHQDVLYEYPGPAVSERDLPICQPHSVCSIVHKRFWASPVVERLCRCLIRTECPWQWADAPDGLTMVLDNRSQLKISRAFLTYFEDPELGCGLYMGFNFFSLLTLQKHKCGLSMGAACLRNKTFCDTVTLLPTCQENVTALTLNLQTTVPIYEMDQENQEDDSEGPKMEVKVSCYCPPMNQWENQIEKESNSTLGGITSVTSQYLCKPLFKCSSNEFCGQIRADYYSTYYRCTCPMGHMCINNDRISENATELLYWGPVLKAYCIPNE